MKILQSLLFLLWCLTSHAQSVPEDWDNYIFSVNGHPVSVNVNLGLKTPRIPWSRPFLVILRVKYPDVNAYGFPDSTMISPLDKIENDLELALEKGNGAVYAGRYTQRGLREYYFYTLDTVDYTEQCQKVLSAFPEFPWLVKARYDPTWANYLEVLYPPDAEKEKMDNARMVALLSKKGDLLSKPRRIEHTLAFRGPNDRRSFLAALDMQGFVVEDMPVEKTEEGEFPFRLVIWRHDRPQLHIINSITLSLRQIAGRHHGRYVSWATQVVRK